jgi:hypothetical protein
MEITNFDELLDSMCIGNNVFKLPNINLYQEQKINLLIEMFNEFNLEDLKYFLDKFRSQKKY